MHMARQSEPSPATDAGVPVLLTRPKAEAQAFANALVERFGAVVHPVVAPLMAPRFLTPTLPDGEFAAVIFTSTRAVEAALRLGANLPRLAFCVGQKTAQAAATGGFDAKSADGDSDALVAMVLAARPGGRVLYLRGLDTRGEIAERLNSAGVTTESAVVYRQEMQALDQPAATLLRTRGELIVPLFSPRAAALFVSAVPSDAKATLHLAAMSSAVAEALDSVAYGSLTIARHPDAKGMLAAVGILLDRMRPP
jgi:uroporphyrinogen-III synthase